MSFGGPYFGFFALKKTIRPSVPGRLAAMTKDNREGADFA